MITSGDEDALEVQGTRSECALVHTLDGLDPVKDKELFDVITASTSWWKGLSDVVKRPVTKIMAHFEKVWGTANPITFVSILVCETAAWVRKHGPAGCAPITRSALG